MLAPDGVVGHVVSSWHGGCTVRVLTDPDSAIAVRTLEHPAVGIAQGHAGSRELTVADFDTGAKVQKGDSVVTSDLANSVYPPDLPVGTVTRVDQQSAGLGLSGAHQAVRRLRRARVRHGAAVGAGRRTGRADRDDHDDAADHDDLDHDDHDDHPPNPGP